MFKKMFIMGILVILSGCSQKIIISGSFLKEKPLEMTDTFLAGAWSADITPLVGMPMAGFSMLSDSGEGFRTRLKARVLYLKPKTGRSIAFIQCDLLSGSLLLHHKVAQLIASETDLAPEAILISGTHTHSAPGNYFESNFYNQYASNQSGFSPEYFEFLSKQIAAAVIQAYQTRKSAKMGTAFTQFKGISENRSFNAYLKNSNIHFDDKINKYEAVNPDFYLIRIDALDKDNLFKPLAVVSSYSIHANSPPFLMNRLYQADLFAYHEREVENRVFLKYKSSWKVVHLAFNQTCGDNNPYYKGKADSYPEIKKIGFALADKAMELLAQLDEKTKENPEILYQSQKVDLFEKNQIDSISLCNHPAIGLSLAGGALGKPLPFPNINWVPFFSPGWPKKLDEADCQGEKRIMLGPLQPLVISKSDFPHEALFQVFQLGDILWATAPFELTFELGRRIQSQLKKSAKEAGNFSIKHALVSGYTNGYFGYATTREEYSLQYYEGGHNLYGPLTGDYISAKLGKLSALLTKKPSEKFREKWNFELKIESFIPVFYAEEGRRRVVQIPNFVYEGKNSEPYYSFKWKDVSLSHIHLHEPLLRVEESKDGKNWQTVADDEGYDLAVIHKAPIFYLQTNTDNIWKINEKIDFMSVYEARWYNPEMKKGFFYRFCILPRKGQPLFYSSAFQKQN